MRKIALIPLAALSLWVGPTFGGATIVGDGSARAEEVGVGIRVNDRDHDRHHWRGHHWGWWGHHDRDDAVVIKRRHHRDYDND